MFRCTIISLLAGLAAANGALAAAATGSAGSSAGEATSAGAPDGDQLQVVWKAQDETIFYHSRSTLYTCDGLKDKITTILRHLGARKDIQISVSSCNVRSELLDNALVSVKFYAPAPAEEEKTEPQVIAAGKWNRVTIGPDKPSGMGRSECDIVEAMRELIRKSFSLRDEKFNTLCFPGIGGGYSMTADVLQVVPGSEQSTGAPPPGSRPELPRGVSRQDYNYLTDGLGTLQATLYRPKTSRQYPLLVYVHGGEWVRGDRSAASYLGPYLASKGVAVFAIDVRMPPQAGYPASLAEINYAVRWARQNATGLGTRPDWIGLYGESSGAHQALLDALLPGDEAYATLPLQGAPGIGAAVGYVVACWPVLDPAKRLALARQRGEAATVDALTQYWAGDEAALGDASAWQALQRAARPLPQLLLLQGADDSYVDVNDARRFVQEYRQDGGVAELHTYAGQPHGFIRAPFDETSLQALDTIAQFAKDQAKARP